MSTLWLLLSLALAADVPAPSVKVGDSALLFSLPAVNEDVALKQVARTHISLSDFTGVTPGFPARAVVVSFIDGKTSVGQLTALGRLQKKFQGRGVRFMAIVADGTDIATVSNMVLSQKLEFPVLQDQYGIVAKRYGVRVLPMTFIIDADGYIDAIGVARDDLETQTDTILTDLLAQ